MATLSIRFKQTVLHTQTLNETEITTIGRSMENTIVIDNVAVSGRHAQITADELGFTIKDLGSTNGTFMDGKPIKVRRLKDGDIILIGKHELIFSAITHEATSKTQSLAQASPLDTCENQTVFLRTESHQEMLRRDNARGRKTPLLVVKFKNNVIYKHLLKNKQTEIGRNAKNEIVIDNTAVSAKHAVINWDDDGFTVQDLKSKNGTFVNKKQVTSCRLQSGDVITIGRHELIFEEAGSYTLAETARSYAEDALSISSSDHTMYLSTKEQQKLLDQNPGQKACLSFITGGKGQFPICKKMTTLGKDNKSDIRVKGLLVAKTAAVIVSEPDGYYLKFIKGFIKPFVNGHKIKKNLRLNPADTIKIGNVTFQFNL